MTLDPRIARTARAAFVAGLVFSSSALADAPVPRDPDVRVDRVQGFYPQSPAKKPVLVMQGNKAFAGYLDRRYFLAVEPYFTVSVNQGGTWNTTDRRLNNQPAGNPDGDSSLVLVSPAPDGRVYVLFASNDGVLSVPSVRSSADGGQTWPNSALALTGADFYSRSEFRLASAANATAFAFWIDNTQNEGVDRSIFMRRTTDGGSTWLPKQQVNVNDAGAVPPRERTSEFKVCTDGATNLYAVWKDKRDLVAQSYLVKPGRVVFRRSTTAGASFLAEERLDKADAAAETESQQPALACDAAGHVLVAWEDQRAGGSDWRIFANSSSDGGATWRAAEVRVDDLPAGKQAHNARVAIGGGSPATLYVAWEDDRSGLKEIYVSRSLDGGATWTAATRVNLGVAPGTIAVDEWGLAADGPNVTITWTDNRNGTVTVPRRDVFSVRSTDLGATFGLPERLDLGTGPGVADSIELVTASAADGSLALVSDFRNDPANADVFGGGEGMAFDPADPDADGFRDAADNCPDYTNAGQQDADYDGVGDACDNFPGDSSNDPDRDGLPAAADNCPLAANNSQDNVDADPFGDACDLCKDAADVVMHDLDRDRAGDGCDTDVDGDGQLNTADTDDDNDGVPDSTDNCDFDRNARQLDADGDGAGDACDTDDLRVQNLRVDPRASAPPLAIWDREAGAVSYNVYIGAVDRLKSGDAGQCYAPGIGAPLFQTVDKPFPGHAYWILATARTATTEGSAGRRSDGTERPKPPCSASLAADWDGDGRINGIDNCPLVANALQEDRDGDAQGDACDPFPIDATNDAADGDSVQSDVDNCPFVYNPDQRDTDADGVGNPCDGCPSDADPLQGDMDRDGLGDACDPDTDGDGVPNAGDPDRDGDGVADAIDNCVFTHNALQADADGDGAGDACDVGGRETLGVTVTRTPDRLAWAWTAGALDYAVYTGLTTELGAGPYGSCAAAPSPIPYLDAPGAAPAGQPRWFLVQPRFADGPGSAGRTSDGVERQVPACP